MPELWLQIKLLSDTTFGRGDGLAGVVNNEVEHDPGTGLPIIKGRTIKGLLVEECANLLYGLRGQAVYSAVEAAARSLFGAPGSIAANQGLIHVGTGTLPPALIDRVHQRIQSKDDVLSKQDVLEALTTIRYQTAVNPESDRPLDNTLRATRVVLRNTIFIAPIGQQQPLNDEEISLLTACAVVVRRAGHSRNRGRGRVQISLEGVDQQDYLARFASWIQGGGHA
jgi:hypothetical protein